VLRPPASSCSRTPISINSSMSRRAVREDAFVSFIHLAQVQPQVPPASLPVLSVSPLQFGSPFSVRELTLNSSRFSEHAPNQPIEKQQQDRTSNRHNKTRCLSRAAPANELTQVCRENGSPIPRAIVERSSTDRGSLGKSRGASGSREDLTFVSYFSLVLPLMSLRTRRGGC
jgi:hypothetical protein